MLIAAGYKFAGGDVTKLTQAQSHFVFLVEELKAGTRKIGIGEKKVSTEERVVPAREFGLKFLKYRKQERERHDSKVKQRISADIQKFEATVSRKEMLLKNRGTITVLPKPTIRKRV